MGLQFLKIKGVPMKFFLLLLLPTMAFAKVKTEKVVYESNGTKMEGVLAYDDSIKKPAPGILVFPEWMGNGPFTEARAKELAALGYVALAADVYGQGVHAKDAKEAGELAGKYKGDRKLMRERAQAGLAFLTSQKRVNKDKVAAMGYCFGGTVALELARDGAPLLSVVSFHGGLVAPVKATTMAPKILVLHGGDDPYVPMPEVIEFQDEMRKAKADWQFISYGNTVHSFTNPEAGNDNSKGAAYNEVSTKRAWNEMKAFFKTTL
jgi:dienelactone hydrolase